MRVLVVEDDAALGLLLQRGLKQEGHEVEYVGDGELALERTAEQRPDLMLLDLGLPGRDGVEVLTIVRERCPETAVLVLSGRSGVQARVACLNAGADDFLPKPFSFSELMARCGAILRRRERFASPVLEQGRVRMHLLERRVFHEGVEVGLSTKEFQVLEALLRQRGECKSRLELLHEVWPEVPESGVNVVDVYVTYLRRKFAAVRPPEEGAAPVIETVRGAGYRLASARKPVERAKGPSSSELSATEMPWLVCRA